VKTRSASSAGRGHCRKSAMPCNARPTKLPNKLIEMTGRRPTRSESWGHSARPTIMPSGYALVSMPNEAPTCSEKCRLSAGVIGMVMVKPSRFRKAAASTASTELRSRMLTAAGGGGGGADGTGSGLGPPSATAASSGERATARRGASTGSGMPCSVPVGPTKVSASPANRAGCISEWHAFAVEGSIGGDN
jgi:hypothetical protein